MDALLNYRGRAISGQDVAFIQALIDAHPAASRRALSSLLCQAWDWRQPNGQLRDMVCRGMMLELHRGGHIKLPPVRFRPPNNVIERRKPPAMAVDASTLCCRLPELKPLVIQQIRQSAEEPLFHALVEAHHYLGYTPPVGEHLKYLVWSQDRPIACLAWSSAPRHLGPRDRFIGFSSCPGSRCPTWPLICWGRWPGAFPGTGSRSMVIRCTIWKPLSTQAGFEAPAIGRRTGFAWG